MVELDNLDVKILTHLQDNSRKSFQEIAKACLTSVPTIKSRVDRLLELGVIRKFTIDIDNSKLGIAEAILLVNARPGAIQDRINLTDVNNISVISVKNPFKKDATIPLASSSITLTCAYCDRKVTGDAVRKKFDDKDYFFCCNTCLGEFEEKYMKMLAGSR